ncbi:MAG: hypothetical protein I8H87_04000 [Comamonadaceae bacterium]|jgi:CRISPR-associated protein Cmr1|nr:hypothetical protein [Comamonadaceae bacterium]
MHLCSYQLRFQTPAFLGNAQQQGQWRTPPFKALLRQWWRVAVAQQIRYNTEMLRQQENALFGTAADGEGDSRQSQIRLRLSHWNMGQLKDWPSHGTLRHPEVSAPVGSDLYLGFGPLEYDRASRSTAIKSKAAIQAGDTATVNLAVPPEHAHDIQTALWLMDRYGTLGGRSRNGWGSLSLQPVDDGTAALDSQLSGQLALPWQDALQRDWPHALGTDAKGALVWQTAAFDDWKKLIQELARIKIALRTQFSFNSGKDAPAPEARHWLSYPVTNHSVKSWGGNARLPNSLRFKVRPALGNPKQLVGVIFHVPCLPPPSFQPHVATIQNVWQTVHRSLDNEQKLTRIPA